ncbi:MAG: response regulator [Myxococcales bacterium]|nr:response regulator [Myxococcales bacterium]
MSPEREEGFDDDVARNVPVSVRIAGALGIVSFVSFGLVDLAVADHNMLPWLVVSRAVVTVLLLALVGASVVRPLLAYASALLVGAFFVISFGAILVTVLVGGSTTGYHEALLLTFFGFALLPTAWSGRTYAVLYGTVVLTWVAVNLGLLSDEPLYRLVVTSSILTVAGVIATTLAVYSRGLRERDFEQRKTIAEANVRLSALDRAKSRFFANLSHEFRTPLTLALAPLESLIEGTDGALSDLQIRHAQLARRSALRLLRLVDDLLVLSRLEAASLPVQRSTVELSSHLQGLVDESMPLAARKGITLDYQAPAQAVRVGADPDALERIVLNLLANALGYTRSGGQVRVLLNVVDAQAELRIIDTGVGIPADKLELIFERFYRVQDGSTAPRAGTGIGLSLVRELVALHQGTIHAESVVGHGTTMVVKLPLLPDDVTPEPALGQVAPLAASVHSHAGGHAQPGQSLDDGGGLPEWHDATRRSAEYRLMAIALATERRRTPRPMHDDGRLPRLLVIEDNTDLVRFIGEVLSAHYSVMSATDGESGVRLAQQFLPDVIMCDLMMPGMSGFDVLARLRSIEETCHIPVIVLSARQDAEARTLARARGADAFLGKPFQVSELLAAVSSLLDRIGLRREHARKESIELAHGVASVLARTLREHAGTLRRSYHALQSSPPCATGSAELHAPIMALEHLAGRLGSVGAADNEAPVLVEADALVQSVVQAWNRPDSVQVRLSLRAEQTLPLRASALSLAITELLDNTQHFAGPRVRVHVQTNRTPGGELTLRIDDNGPGLPPDQRERVFQPFYTTQPDRASGLGLAIVRDVIRAHGGSVTFTDSRTGSGASVLIRLPLETSSPEKPHV